MEEEHLIRKYQKLELQKQECANIGYNFGNTARDAVQEEILNCKKNLLSSSSGRVSANAASLLAFARSKVTSST